MKNYFLTFVINLLCLTAVSQTTFPINGVANTYEEIHVSQMPPLSFLHDRQLKMEPLP